MEEVFKAAVLWVQLEKAFNYKPSVWDIQIWRTVDGISYWVKGPYYLGADISINPFLIFESISL